MLTFFGTELLDPFWESSTLCIGVFDGVHLGHAEVISRAVAQARNYGEPCVLLTFDRHPAHILAPERTPKTIASLSQNLRRFRMLGVDIALVVPFNFDTSQTSAEKFYESVIKQKIRAARIVVGHDFAFGKGRKGDSHWLSGRIDTTVVEPVLTEGVRVSSSTIRTAVSSGELEMANLLLGRDFAIQAIILHGEKLGRQIGYPTLNCGHCPQQLTPANGIYAGYAKGSFGEYQAAISIGTRPTVGGKNRTIEAYLIDYPGPEIYGHSFELSFCKKLRNEIKFESLEELKSQISKDVEVTRKALAGTN